MKSWSGLRKFGFCSTLVVIGVLMFFTCRLPDWRIGVFVVFCLLFLSIFATLYLLFRPQCNCPKATMNYECSDNPDNGRVRSVAAKPSVPIHPGQPTAT
jgi:hypothetical protein